MGKELAKIRILLINYEFPPFGGGAGNASENIAKQFILLGCEVVVLTARYKQLKEYEEADGYKIYRVKSIRKRIDRSNPLEMLHFAWCAIKNSKKIIKEFRPTVAVAFFAVPSGIVAYYLKKKYSLPYILSLRGGDVSGFMKGYISLLLKLSKPLTKRIWLNALHVVVTNNFMQKLAEYTATSLNLTVDIVPNGVDCGKFTVPFSASPIPPVRILYVGRLVQWQKGLEVLLEAMEQLKNDAVQDVVLDVVGDGPFRKHLEELVVKRGLNSMINFYGWINKNELPLYYQKAHIFVLPTVKDGMSNALLEAMACGLPVITTPPAAVGLVEDGKQGIVVMTNNKDALIAALKFLIDNKENRIQMGIAARKKAETMDWERVAKDYAKLVAV